MKKYSLYISKEQATLLLKLVDESGINDKEMKASLSRIANDSSAEIINSGRSIKDDSKKTSKNHKIVKEIHTTCFPNHKVNQNVFLSLNMNGRQTKCEFDIHDLTYNLLIEIHGKQHYEFTPFFHTDKAAFMMQQVRDEEKKKWAVLNGYTYLAVAEKDVLQMNKLFKTNSEIVQQSWVQLIKQNIMESEKLKKELLEEQ